CAPALASASPRSLRTLLGQPPPKRNRILGSMATEKSGVDASEELLAEFGENASYVAEQLTRYRANPESVDEEWRAFFRERFSEPAPRPQKAEPAPAAPAPAAAAPRPAAEKPLPAEAERRAMRGGALRIAENMEASLQVPTATSQRQIPIKLLDENRRLINEWRVSNDQSKISFTQLVTWSILRALDAFPRLNDAYDASGGAPSRVRRDHANFGLPLGATQADGSGTVLVPNVKRAETMRFSDFVAASDDLIARARQGKLEVRDFEGTTISLTNPGTLGTTASVPRLMPGQGTIVATGAMD